MSLNDLHAIAELRRREARLFESAARAVNPRKIVFYMMDPWQIGVVEQFLHTAFELRGHNPVTVYYDGLLPITSWENYHVPPPPVEKLTQRARFMLECFGIDGIGTSHYVDGATITRAAERLIDATPTQQWRGMVYRGIEIGRIALRDLFQYSMGHFKPCTESEVAEFRRHLIHAVMSVDLADAILAREKPDIVVLVNGKSVMYSYMYEAARRKGVQVTTWEEGMFFDASVVFANNARAIDFPVEPEVWAAHRATRPTLEELATVDGYFERWRNQSATSHRYYDQEIRDRARIRRELKLPDAGRLTSIFTNIIWDTNALEKDAAFDGMMDWVFTTIDLTSHLTDMILIVRAHPGETKCRFKTRTPVRGMIERRYGGVPRHVRIVDGESELSSYEIARISDACAVYTSTLGVELALMGLQPLICGTPTYSGRGFTNDVRSKSQYRRLIYGEVTATASNVELLKRFMNLVIFKLVKRPEFFVGSHGSPQIPRVAIETFAGFPDSMPVFSSIVDAILSGGTFIRLSKEIAATVNGRSDAPSCEAQCA